MFNLRLYQPEPVLGIIWPNLEAIWGSLISSEIQWERSVRYLWLYVSYLCAQCMSPKKRFQRRWEKVEILKFFCKLHSILKSNFGQIPEFLRSPSFFYLLDFSQYFYSLFFWGRGIFLENEFIITHIIARFIPKSIFM